MTTEAIAALARQYPFEHLTSEQQEAVLAHFSAQEYNALRQTMLAAVQMDQDVAPPPRLQAALLEKARQADHHKTTSPATTRPLSLQPIVFWRALAACLALALLWVVFQKPNTVLLETPPSVITTVERDTVYVEKIQWRTRYLPTPAVPGASPAAGIPMAQLEEVLPFTTMHTAAPADTTVGASLAEEPALWQFLDNTSGADSLQQQHD